jgi:ergothioneine biosynthesis protein EgtB
MTVTSAARVDRAIAIDRFRRIRERTRMLFDLLADSTYYDRPIALRNPVVFYEGHLPAFAVNTLLKKALGRPGIDRHLEEIFARGIDPETEATALARGNPAWPSRADVRAYAAAADRAIEEVIQSASAAGAGRGVPLQEAVWAVLEHEEMHQETLAYMWHELPYEKKRRPDGYTTLPTQNSQLPTSNSQQVLESGLGVGNWELGVDQVTIPAGKASLGTRSDESVFAWDNELEPHEVEVPAFAIDVHNVTNGQFMGFVESGGYREARWWRPEDWSWVVSEGIAHPRFWAHTDDGWQWRAMFELVPLPPSWPVYVTWAEARAYAAWRGMRLPTEAEFHRASAGSAPVNVDFARWDPVPVGTHPEAASVFGVHDLVGNGWEWTFTPFAPFPGFTPLASYPEYSADFFDGDHFVLKGASPVTARGLIRSGFRNWFRPRYPYVYAGFRCVT